MDLLLIGSYTDEMSYRADVTLPKEDNKLVAG